MNYRHAFHAGNHGDVVKHIVLARALTYMMRKDAPLAMLDAHAGIGLYDLTGLEAFKTGEWRGGIGKLLTQNFAGAVGELLAPYLDVVRQVNPDGELRHYPGSPELARRLLRPHDRLLLNELHPQDHETLLARLGGDGRVRVTQVDAAQAVKAALPFHEKRGLVLIDPAFEVTDETQRVSRMVSHALRRMAQACLVIWYPVTTQGFADELCAALEFDGAKSVLRVELLVRHPRPEGGLAGSGLVVVNPPWVLHDELKLLLPVLAQALGEADQGQHRLEWMLQPT